ncbi:P-loop containing nucleoside triphosphate hydrolase protein [Rhizophagus clarus]|uniref:P-loop containing nucleoside triphosphate hydrolase protein n=1 Tax=Rhizophagus clarus TaxID=94130 RepID=A0A8H3LBK8_9GLOM|nr:P-loop containing nucleoside triphosphate hydrolase protein [Rhizophagus clarus]
MITSEVKMTLNCLILGETSLKRILPVNILGVNPIIKSNTEYCIKYNELKISDLKYIIWSKKSNTLKIDYTDLELWMVNIIQEEVYKLKDVKESEIREKLGATKLSPTYTFQNYFPKTFKYNSNIHIIVQVPAATGPNWNDPSSIYEWIQQFNLNPGRNRLVKSFGKDFEFYGRDNTIDTLWNGDKITNRNGIVDRFLVRRSKDKSNHPLPVLAAGPGTGKSRFLDEVERLLTLKANNSDNEDIRNAFSNLVVINTTYGSESPASNSDIRDVSYNKMINAQLSLAVRILFEYFRPQTSVGEFTFSSSCSLCNNYSTISHFTLDTALQVVYDDIIKRKNQEKSSNPLLVLVLGIDEFNRLYDTNQDVCKELTKSIMGILCHSPANIFFIPILAGTIEGPLDQYITFSNMNKPLRLPLYLLGEDHAIEIGKAMNLFDDNYINLHPYFRISIGDIGGHLRALESFYSHFKDIVSKKDPKNKNPNVDFIMNCVRTKISDEYHLAKYSKWMAEVLAKAILNLPVRKTDKIKLDDKLTSYQDLSSMGIIYLVPKVNSYGQRLFYIQIPYMWASILVQHSNYPGMDHWNPMFDYGELMYWQNFERFNAKFWALRLSLFRLLGYEKINLKDLLRGAKFSRAFPDGEVFLSNDLKIFKLRHQYPEDMNNDNTRDDNKMDTEDTEDVDDDDNTDYVDDDDDYMQDDSVMDADETEKDDYTYICARLDYPDTENTSFIYLNANGANFGIFEYFKYGTNNKLCLALQVKITNKPKIINFNEEYNKVTETIERIPADKWIHLFLTNSKVNSLNIKNKKNIALVTEKEFHAKRFIHQI